jgi:para-nitrobenzyl esterase
MRALLALALAAALTACLGSEAPPGPDASSRRSLSLGQVVGFASEGAHVWRGLPFAHPPTGPRRWAPPLPPAPWAGVREATAHGPICPQLDQGGEPVGDEDCLYLNVFAPRFTRERVPRGDAQLPVMLFIHGGGNSIGSAVPFDGSRLAEENRVVVVALQYRLGVLGWFSHPALRAGATTAEARSGNWGTLDMIRALEWVRDEIASFGGDPERVTLFGESAGGIDVYSLLLSPRAGGLFHRAIAQSGFATTFTRAQAEHRIDALEPGDAASSAEVLLRLLVQEGQAEDRDAAVAVADGLAPEQIASYLRERSPAELLGIFDSASEGFAGGIYVAPFALRDGSVIPDEPPLELLARGAYNQVPVVLGTNRDEHKLFLAFVSPHVRQIFGMPIGLRDARRYDLVSEYGAKLWKATGADEPASAMRTAQGASVFGYRFDWDELAQPLWIDLPRLIGAGHALELLFVFGGTRSDFASWLVEDVESAEQLSQQMRSYWAQLAASGDPGRGQRGELPAWSAWQPSDGAPKFMVFDSARDGGLRMSAEALTRGQLLDELARDERLRSSEERCEIYATFVQWSDALSPEQYAEVANGECRAHPLAGRTLFD